MLFWLLYYAALFCSVEAPGLLLLYRPKDVSEACILSKHLRFDLSFGMGMSDTITLVFRTLAEIDYACTVEIATEPFTRLLVVIRYPTLVRTNCDLNRDAFTILKKLRCIRLCDVINDRSTKSHYSTFHINERLRFKFVSNSSINVDLNAHFYQVTVTSARYRPATGCVLKNETVCTIGEDHFCFTSGVVCDGIKNCGVDDWFDERKSQCSLPIERLGYAPVVAVLAAILCSLLAIAHIIQRCLPPLADSFFIFNANEDNRFCIDPLLVPGDNVSPDIPIVKHTSLIPVSLSSSEESAKVTDSVEGQTVDLELQPLGTQEQQVEIQQQISQEPQRKNNGKSLTERIQETLKSFTFSRRKSSQIKNIT